MSIVLRVAGIFVIAVLVFSGWLFFRIGYHQQLQMFLPGRMDNVAPNLPRELARPAILVFSKTNGFRHHEAIPAAETAFRDLAAASAWSIFVTENGAVFSPENLEQFDVVIWSNASGRILLDDQRAALRHFIESGGGFVGLHAAGDASHESWPWYVNEVIGAEFTGHPRRSHIQQAEIIVEEPDHPTMQHLPARWSRSDEWYSFAESPRGRVKVLARLDESSYAPESLAMGDDHPIVWSRELQRGRIFYSALGHTGEAWSESAHVEMVGRAIAWAGRLDEPAVE